MGRAGSIVDNQSAGGIVAKVDTKSGILSAGSDGLPDYSYYEVHPDSKVQLQGLTVPFWDEAKQLAEQALSVFPNLRFAGLDIAIGKTAPCVVELNVSPDKEGAAFMGLPSGRYLVV